MASEIIRDIPISDTTTIFVSPEVATEAGIRAIINELGFVPDPFNPSAFLVAPSVTLYVDIYLVADHSDCKLEHRSAWFHLYIRNSKKWSLRLAPANVLTSPNPLAKSGVIAAVKREINGALDEYSAS